MAGNTYTITGRVIDTESQRGIPQIRVEAWDKDHQFLSVVGMSTTDDQGAFRIDLDDSYFQHIFGDRRPDLYFNAFFNDVLVANTEGTAEWSVQQPDHSVQIRTSGIDKTHILTGVVVDQDSGSTLPNVRVEAWDQDRTFNNSLFSTTTAEDGRFRIGITDQAIQQIFGDSTPNFFFEVFSGDTLLGSTDGSTNWRPFDGDTDITISVSSHSGGNTSYTLSGYVWEEGTQNGVSGIRVEAWDEGHQIDAAIFEATTDDSGSFQLTFDDSQLQQAFGDRDPSLYFKAFRDSELAASTDGSYTWTKDQGNAIVNITVPAVNNTYTVTCHVTDAGTQSGASGIYVEAWDQGHVISSAVATGTTDSSGNLQFTFTDSSLQQSFGDRTPTIYFKAFRDGSLVTNTDGSTTWTKSQGSTTVNITVPAVNHTYVVSCHVIESGTQNAVSGITVEAWDQGHVIGSAIATGTTDSSGNLQYTFTDSSLQQVFGDRTPTIYFKAFRDNTLVTNTDGSITWTKNQGSTTVTIGVPRPDQSYTVNCHVTEAGTGNVVSGIRVEAWDQDYVLTSAVMTGTTDSSGNHQFAFTDSSLEQSFGSRTPSLYFKAFRDTTLVASTDGSITWTPDDTTLTVDISIPAESNGEYTIICHVMVAETQADVPGIRVEAWDEGHVLTSSIISATTGANGDLQFNLTDSYLHQYFGTRTPSLYFKAFQNDTLLASTDGSQSWTPTDGNITVEIYVSGSDLDGGSPPPSTPQRGCGDATDTSSYSVTGTVKSTDRAGLYGLQVEIVDQGVGGYTHLASATTDDCGKFSVSVAATLITSRGKQRPDLQARVSSSDGTFIAASDIHYNASGTETLDVTLPPTSADLNSSINSEHDALTDALSVYYEGQLRNLQETDAQQDITYLANKSGWDARTVAMAALADQFSANSGQSGEGGIDPSFYYALFRAGLPTNEAVLYRTDASTLTSILNTAVDQGIIAPSRASQIPTVVQNFQTLSAQKLLTAPAIAGPSTMQSMLQASGLNSTQQQQFASLYTTHSTDMAALWEAATGTLGQTTTQRLQVDGKLAFLTINNAPLMTAIHSSISNLTDTVQLAQAGFYRASQWEQILGGSIPVPDEIPGDDATAKKNNYAEYLAALVRMSYPTASVAQQVNSGDIPVSNASDVHSFLTTHQGSFELGTQPVEQYIAQNDLTVDANTVTQLKRLERVYQMTPDDESMAGMLSNNLDAAATVVRYDRQAFVDTFSDQVGGTDNAEKIHDRAVQIHHAVLNVALSYLTASNGIPLGTQPLDPDLSDSDSARQLLQPAPMGPGSVTLPGPLGISGPWSTSSAADVLAYGTLESLFGEMDFCACDECRSILSPAAYLVDLLNFINHPAPPPGYPNPLDVLLDRRPDVANLPLTCENTNTALPYIDVVNETLEYYVTNSAHPLTLTGYLGHDTGTMASEDLLASPAFVNDTAYTILASQRFPMPLPFHRPLESLRRHFEKFGVPLPLSMERLRPSDNLERGSQPYGWRDILMEEIWFSREEYQIMTDSGTVPLWDMYGFASAVSDSAAITELSNAKKFTRRLNISYEELIAVLQTRFINPNADLIPKLERLGVDFAQIKALNDHTITGSAFDALLPTGAGAPDPAQYGGDIKGWLTDSTNYPKIMGLILLTDTSAAADPCSFDTLELRYSMPMASLSDTSTRIAAADYIRILRFIRLWKKLGWTIDQTDAAICALYNPHFESLASTDVNTAAALDAGFLLLLPRLGIIVRVMRELNLTVQRDLLPLLACWSDIATQGPGTLYRQMFLNPTILGQDAVYADNGYGGFLTNTSVYLFDHAESLRAAFNLTGDDYDRIVAALGFTSTTVLNISNISKVFRYGYLARALRISVRELLLLMNLTGLDPFAIPSLTTPAILEIARLVDDLKKVALKTTTALYLVWNQDLSGSSAPTAAQINEFIRSLRDDFSKIETEFAIADDPTGEIAKARMTLVYGTDATDFFFGLLNDTFVSEEAYNHYEPTFNATLSGAILTAVGTSSTGSPRLTYDDFRKQLTFAGVMSSAQRTALLALTTNPTVTASIPSGSLSAFQASFASAVSALYTTNTAAVNPFFARYTELLPLYNTFVASPDPAETKRSALLANFLPALKSKRKAQQALQHLADAAQTDLASAQTLVDPSPVASGLNAEGSPSDPALNDLLAVETEGLTVQYYNSDTVGTSPQPLRIDSNLVYAAASGNTLPANTVTPGNAVSGRWTGSIEVPESNLYNIIIDTEAAATVSLKIDGATVAMSSTVTGSGVEWRNASQISLKAGTLYTVKITVEKVVNTLSMQWETLGRGRAPIPAEALYPSSLFDVAQHSYVRFLKAAALADALGLTVAEAARPVLSGSSWLNALPVAGDSLTPTTLLSPLRQLVDYAMVKNAVSVGSDALLDVMNDLAAVTPSTDSLLALTGWDLGSLNAVLTRLAGSVNYGYLLQGTQLRRVYDVFQLLGSMGIPASALIAATTNEPTATTVKDLQSALRARYAVEDWRDLVQPINDAMRSLQRDALVAHILHQLSLDPTSAHINTVDKLFEYFLMDVQMEPCMQTSRIRHALSSVQLFIERGIMNLEPRVPAASLNADQWEWMKRYRVWEANRKVFLYPENWLEPELRDDKSPFFKEIETELLQNDVTEEVAASAMLNYLTKLEEVARLEPSGFFHIPADPVARTGEINHVVARTAGAHRKYYYRRREYGYWTAWEEIKLDIEDNPVVPVIWKDRLLLLWLRILKKGPETNSAKPTGSDLPSMVVPADPQMTTQAVLCWSEYYNGKWQPAKTSDLEHPATIGNVAPDAFDRSTVTISTADEDDGLRINVNSDSGWTTFFMYNTHSTPDQGYSSSSISLPFYGTWYDREIGDFVGNLSYMYITNTALMSLLPMSRNVLRPLIPYSIIPPRHPLSDIWNAPIFYQDKRHVFYVSSTQQEIPIRLYTGYGTSTAISGGVTGYTGLVTSSGGVSSAPVSWSSGAAFGISSGTPATGAVQQFISGDANIRQAIGTTSQVTFGDRQVGPAGSISLG